MTTKRGRTTRQGKHLPEFARQVREFREECGLTQPQLAHELETTRGAVAQWEGATREPNEQNYSRLRDLARARKLKVYEEFFSSRAVERIRDREHKLDEADAMRFSQILIDGLGDKELESLVEFSQMNQTDFAKHQANRMAEAMRTLTNGEMNEEFNKIVFEALIVKQLSMPGGVDAFRRIQRLEREIGDIDKVRDGGASEAQHRTIKRIIEGWAVAVLEGKVPDRNELEKDLAQSNLLRATLARVSGVMAEKLVADREGQSYSDEEFVNDLKWVLNMRPR